MGDVVSLKKEPEVMVRICGCGCRSFLLISTGDVECTHCGESQDGSMWVDPLALVRSDPPEAETFTQSIVDDLTPRVITRELMKRIGEVAALAVVFKGANEFQVWDRPMDEAERKALPETMKRITDKIWRRL